MAGSKTDKKLALVKAALDKELATRKLTSQDYRVLGYNGPGVPRTLKTWEMIAVLPQK